MLTLPVSELSACSSVESGQSEAQTQWIEKRGLLKLDEQTAESSLQLSNCQWPVICNVCHTSPDVTIRWTGIVIKGTAIDLEARSPNLSSCWQLDPAGAAAYQC